MGRIGSEWEIDWASIGIYIGGEGDWLHDQEIPGCMHVKDHRDISSR